ncbi:DUF2125 domain-containing protein [Magnetospirillum sp. UT-4]|uniref:DUF2125 domain-containing protein n=1 Tax=Magnetospirillum sp. UT-4 TaxID=2681467 RepID=UPI0013829543|nr:DUF2125 domain-containing protein [Magnetospirillum sp. UT-4]CAA7617598.1 conserved exported hypothetical protein [Magnetospirillum sp. UT-4]
MPIRRLSLAAALAVAVLAGLYAAYWFHVAGEVRKGLEHWAEDRRAQGWTVAWESMEPQGFPLRVGLALAAPELAVPGGVAWRGQALALSARPHDLTRVTLSAPGRHRLSGPAGGAEFSAGELLLDLDLDRAGRIELATLKGSALASGSTAVATLAASWDPLGVAAPAHDTPTARFSAAAGSIRLPEGLGAVLGRDAALIAIDGHVRGPLPPSPAASDLLAWSAAGGVIELEHLEVDWEPVAVEADGTLALDGAGQPLAALSARVRGFGALMDRLAEARVLDAGTAAAARMVLSLMARPDAQGRPAVPVPLTVQDGGVWMGPARIGSVPPLNWSAASGMTIR